MTSTLLMKIIYHEPMIMLEKIQLKQKKGHSSRRLYSLIVKKYMHMRSSVRTANYMHAKLNIPYTKHMEDMISLFS